MTPKDHSFDDLVEAIYGAVSRAREGLEKQHMFSMGQYFEEDGKPKCIKISVPTLDPKDGDAQEEIFVPMFSIANHSSIKLKELVIEMKVRMSTVNYEDGENDSKIKKLAVSLSNSIFNRKNMAKIKITLQGDSPPEGIAKVNDRIVKLIP